MPVQFLRVRYAEARDVYIDGEKSGRTNRKLRVGEGTHRVHLGEPRDYAPSWRQPTVTGTSAIRPMEVSFEPLED